MYELMYKMKPRQYESGHILIREGQKVESIIFLLNGILEVYTKCEGNEFVIERLYSGSVLNYRVFITEDLMHVNVRCKENANTLELEGPLLDLLCF